MRLECGGMTMKTVHAVIKPFKLDDVREALTAIGVVAVGAFVMIAASIVWYAVRLTIGLRIDEEAESLGLDQVELGIEAYAEFGQGSQSI